MKFDPAPVIRPPGNGCLTSFCQTVMMNIDERKEVKNVDYNYTNSPVQMLNRNVHYKQCLLARGVMAATKSQSSLPTEIVIHF